MTGTVARASIPAAAGCLSASQPARKPPSHPGHRLAGAHSACALRRGRTPLYVDGRVSQDAENPHKLLRVWITGGLNQWL